MTKLSITITFILLTAVTFSFAQTTNTYHGGGSTFFSSLSYNIEWQILEKLSFVGVARLGPYVQIGQAESYGTAWMAELAFEPHWYFTCTEQNKLYTSLFVNAGVMSIPYKGDLYELHNNFQFGWGVKLAYKWIGLYWDIYDTPLRLFLEPMVFYRMTFFSDDVTGFQSKPAHWIGLGFELGIDTPIRKEFTGVEFDEEISTNIWELDPMGTNQIFTNDVTNLQKSQTNLQKAVSNEFSILSEIVTN